MAKIIGVCGSPRKGTTEHVLKRALAAAEQVPGIETELMLLRGKKIHRCIHCDKWLYPDFPKDLVSKSCQIEITGITI